MYMEHLFLMFLDHTQRRSTVGRTPLDEWSSRRRDLYLTTHDTHNRQISLPPVGFEPKISAGERPVAAHLLRSWVRIPPGARIFVCCDCRVLSGRGLCDEPITRPEEPYRLWCVVVCAVDISRMGAPYIYDISSLRVKQQLALCKSIFFKTPVPTRRQEAGINYRSPAVLKGPVPLLCCLCFFCLSLQCRHLSSVQINPFRPSPSHSTTESQCFRFIVKICSPSALPLPGLELALGGYRRPV